MISNGEDEEGLACIHIGYCYADTLESTLNREGDV